MGNVRTNMKREKFNKKRAIILFLSLLCCVLSCTTQQPASIQANVTINTDATVKTYNPMIFGGFLEHFGDQIYGGVKGGVKVRRVAVQNRGILPVLTPSDAGCQSAVHSFFNSTSESSAA
jgi:hypothetical protein